MPQSLLHGLQLNALVALDALLSERSVTRAARRTGVTQPAMSQTLGRLREPVSYTHLRAAHHANSTRNTPMAPGSEKS